MYTIIQKSSKLFLYSHESEDESMFRPNSDYLKLPGSYLFSTIAKKVNAYQQANPDNKIIRLGIGDVSLPLCLPASPA